MQGQHGRKLLLIEHVSHSISNILLIHQMLLKLRNCICSILLIHEAFSKFEKLSPMVSEIDCCILNCSYLPVHQLNGIAYILDMV
jgi:hypothetical protein